MNACFLHFASLVEQVSVALGAAAPLKQGA